MELADSDAFGECSVYKVEVVPAMPKAQPARPPCASLNRIERISCLSGGLNVKAGQETRQRILLNRLQDFPKPGTYQVKVTRQLSYFKGFGKVNQKTGKISATFLVSVVEPSSPDELEAVFAPYIEALSSSDFKKKAEAAIVVSTLAATFLEPYLLN